MANASDSHNPPATGREFVRPVELLYLFRRFESRTLYRRHKHGERLQILFFLYTFITVTDFVEIMETLPQEVS